MLACTCIGLLSQHLSKPLLSILADRSARSVIGYWHVNAVCLLSVRPSTCDAVHCCLLQQKRLNK